MMTTDRYSNSLLLWAAVWSTSLICSCFTLNDVSFSHRHQQNHVIASDLRRKRYNMAFSNAKPIVRRYRTRCRQLNMVTFSTSGSSASSIPSDDSQSYKVIYQKVIRASDKKTQQKEPKDETNFFLANLVEYIQNYYELPSDLPMLYKKSTQEDCEDDASESKHSIMTIDSPLSKDENMTKLDVEVVGIYPSDVKLSVPTMAMVIVKKQATRDGEESGILMQRMFDESEKKILKSLERGLDDFMQGRITVISSTPSTVLESNDGSWVESGDWDLAQNFEGFNDDDTLEDLFSVAATTSQPFLQDLKKRDESRGEAKNVVIDTTSSSVDDLEEEMGNDSKDRSISLEPQDTNQALQSVNMSSDEDFAVKAARAAALRQKSHKSKPSSTESINDYAVNAAKEAAKKRLAMEKDQSNENVEQIEKCNDSIAKNKDEIQVQEIRTASSIPDGISEGKAISMPQSFRVANGRVSRHGQFRATISTPDKWSQKRSEKLNKPFIEERSQDTKHTTINEDNEKDDQKDQYEINLSSSNEIEKDQKEESNHPRRNLQTSSKVTKTDAEIEQDIMKAALDLMPGESSSTDASNDLTAEELLKDVLKFGEEKEKEEKVGSGFADGVFSKAKELVEQTKSMSQGGDESRPFKETNEPSVKELSVEEELKKIFAAGESIAEGRMTRSMGQDSTSEVESVLASPSRSEVNEEYVERLIDSDKTVPRNALSLDEELAQLEVRINRSPGESDSETNSIFDVFSGPEVYNPNVDPESAVNWPGADLGTRTDLKLPRELSEAIKTAEYAANILSKIVEKGDNRYFLDGVELKDGDRENLLKCVQEGVRIGLIRDPLLFLEEKSRLVMVIDEMKRQPEERFDDIASNYRDLLLSDNFIDLVKERLNGMVTIDLEALRQGVDTGTIEAEHESERRILTHLTQYAQLLLKEARALGAELENAQLEVIRSICVVAMDPRHTTDEETAVALSDAVRDMRPLLDEQFVAYLKYAIAEEEGRLARAGLLDDEEHNRWLFVLKIVQEGVYRELSRGIQRHIDHIGYVLRMEEKKERRMLLSQLIDKMPSMDIRPFVKVVDNIAASLGSSAKGEFDAEILGSMTNRVLQLRRDVQELLPPERIKLMSKDADEWASRQKQRLLNQRQTTQQRLKSSKDTESFEIDGMRKGEMEDFR